MIPEIGVMIGMYIFTRMLALANRRGDRREHWSTIVFCVLTIVVAVFVMLDLFLRGATTTIPSLR